MADNGEELLLKTIASCRPVGSKRTIVLDVGANVGDYASAVVRAIAGAEVHSFEIVPETRDRLRANLRDTPGCIVAECGLSDSPGRLSMLTQRQFDTEARQPMGGEDLGNGRVVECEVVTGDSYLQGHGLGQVDLLKVDTEGHEIPVLLGFSEPLRQGRVVAIQFEYGFTWVRYRRFLRDAYDLLKPAGFTIGRLYPDGVRFKTYDVPDDHFRMGNYVAVHSSATDLIERLSI